MSTLNQNYSGIPVSYINSDFSEVYAEVLEYDHRVAFVFVLPDKDATRASGKAFLLVMDEERNQMLIDSHVRKGDACFDVAVEQEHHLGLLLEQRIPTSWSLLLG